MIVRAGARLARGVAVAVAAWCLAMVIFELLPGDAARTLAGPQASAADVERLRDTLARRDPSKGGLASRLACTLHRAPPKDEDVHADCTPLGPLHVNLGRSFVFRRPVAELVFGRLPASAMLALAVTASTLALGLGLGFAGATKRGGTALVTSSRLLAALPAYAVGLALQEVFARRLGWVPLEASFEDPLSTLRSAALPIATLTASLAGPYVATARARWSSLAAEPFVGAAIARGSSPRRALWRHGLRQAFGALVTLACLDAGALVGGSVLTERLFRWPGLGSLTLEALLGRDVPVLGGVVLVAALAIASLASLAEVARAMVDPRVTGS